MWNTTFIPSSDYGSIRTKNDGKASAADTFKPKTGSPGKPAKAAKLAAALLPNLKPAFKLIDDIENLAGKDQRLLVKVTSLRECLARL